MFGKGQNTLTDTGQGTPATITGNIYFGGSLSGADSLTIGRSGTLTGAVFEGSNGKVKADVKPGGTLNLQNSYIPGGAPTGFTPSTTTAAPLVATDFDIEQGANWSINVSQPFNLMV